MYWGKFSRRDFLKLGGAAAIWTKIEQHEQPAEIPVTEHGGVPKEYSLLADRTGVRR